MAPGPASVLLPTALQGRYQKVPEGHQPGEIQTCMCGKVHSFLFFSFFFSFLFLVISTPNVGLELTTPRSIVPCSTD